MKIFWGMKFWTNFQFTLNCEAIVHIQVFTNWHWIIKAIYYKLTVTHLRNLSRFLPKNISVLTAPNILFDLLDRCHLIWLVSSFQSKLQFLAETRYPLRKIKTVVGILKDCVLLKATIGEQIRRIYKEQSDKPYVGVFSFDKSSLLIRDLELVKIILVKGLQTFMDLIFSVEDKIVPYSVKTWLF